MVRAVAGAMRTAQSLNSGMRDVGSSAGLVSRLARPRAAPVERHEDRVRADVGRQRGRGRAPRRAAWSPHRVARRRSRGGARAPGAARRTRRRPPPCSASTRRVCVPDWYWRSTRPVVRHSGYSSSGRLGRRPVARRRGSARGRPRWRSARGTGAACPGARSSGHGQNDAALARDALVGDARVVGGPPALARRSSSKTSSGSASESRPGSRGARRGPRSTSRSLRTPSRRLDARRRRRITRPSRLVIVPSSSAHCVTGRTTSAQLRPSRRGRGRRPPGSRARRARSSTWPACGADTTGSSPSPAARARRRRCRARRASRRPSSPGPGELVRRHAPHARDVRARRRVVDAAVARQLVGLLAVLAPALAVALAGQAAVAAPGPAGLARARARG